MENNFPNRYATAGGDSNVMKDPQHVDGFIDLEILINIHKCLSESKSGDDCALGVWVKANYLQEPVDLSEEKTRPIRDSEGYSKLDKAYRRARTLTGKAQDKWPFLNRDWKKLSSTLIKAAISGEAAISVARTNSNGAGRDSPMSNGLNDHRNNTLNAPRSQASLNANSLSTHQTQKIKSTRPADRLLHPQGTEQTAPRKDLSPVSKTSGIIDTTSLDSSVNGTPSSVDNMRETESGKVRGPNGRYMHKDNPTPPAKMKANNKQVKKSRTKVTLKSEIEDIADSSNDEDEESKDTSRSGVVSSESGREATQDGSESPMSASSAAAATYGFPVSAVLAVEAEAVPSNLDRLPTGYYAHKKRKSDSSIQRVQSKRGRGSRGGVIGRPRKSEILVDHTKPELENVGSMEVEEPTPQQTPQPETPASAPARRSSRKSAASALELSTPWDPTGDVLFSGASQKQQANRNNAAQTNGNNDATESAKASGFLSHVSERSKLAHAYANGTHIGTPPKPIATQAKPQKTPAPKKRVSFSSGNHVQPGDMQFFARITTASGVQEVPLLEEDLTHEVGLVKSYAEWLNDGKKPVSFEMFKDIVKHTRGG